MISETMIRYGSRVWRQGKSRPCPANHSSSAPRIVAKVSGGRLKRELLLSVISLYYINYRTYAVGVLPGGLEGRVPSGCPSKNLSLSPVWGGFAAPHGRK